MNLVDGQSKEIKTKENSLSTNQSTVILLDKGIDTTCMESCIAINTIYEGIIRLDERKKSIYTNERINKIIIKIFLTYDYQVKLKN